MTINKLKEFNEVVNRKEKLKEGIDLRKKENEDMNENEKTLYKSYNKHHL
jgi:hypothetical protein